MYLCLHSFKLMLGEMETITNKEEIGRAHV